MADCTDLSG